MSKYSLSLVLVCALLLAAGTMAWSTVLLDVPMDAQINLGYTYNTQSPNGDAIYAAFNSGVLSFETDGVDGWSRQNILAPGWWYFYLDFNLAGLGGQDISDPTKLYKLEFDCRYFQDPITNTNPYGDAPVFLRIYSYAADGNTVAGYRDYSIVYATQLGDPPYPDWTHVSVVLNNSALQPYTDTNMVMTDFDRFRFYGTDWSGKPVDSDDFVDFKNVQLVEEIPPATVSGIVTGPGGSPVEGAWVGIKTTTNAAADATYYLRTAADGSYSRLLEPGTYYVAAWMPGYLPTADLTVNVAGVNIPNQNLQLTTKAADNVAIGATATATSVSEPASNAVDDNLGTRYISVNPLGLDEQDQSITFDMGSVQSLTGLTILWENAHPEDYEVLITSDDPAGSPTWTQVYAVEGGNGGADIYSGVNADPIRLPAGTSARAIRIHATDHGPYPVYSIWEFQAHGTTYNQVPVTDVTIQQVKAMALGSTVQLLKPVSMSGMWDGGESTLFRDRFWMEEPDQSAGIRIDMVDHYAWAGEYDYVKGELTQDPITGEKYILGQSINWLGTTAIPRPYAMANKSAATALPVGLLVKTWGKVVEQNANGYTIDDGSGTPIQVVAEGLKPSPDTFVTVSGALTGEPAIYTKAGDGYIRSWLLHGGYSTPDPLPAEGWGDSQNPAAKWGVWQQMNLDADFLASVGGEAAVQPEPGDVGPNGGVWFPYTHPNWFIPLDGITWTSSGQAMITVYASVWVFADREYKGYDPILGQQNDGLQILIGSDDGYRLYINGQQITEYNIWRGAGADTDAIDYDDNANPLVLNQGWNHILAKSNNITGGWAYGMRFMADDPLGGGKLPLNLPISLVPGN